MAVEEYGADIINDVGAPASAPDQASRIPMFRMVARLGVPYVLTSTKPDLRQTLLFFAEDVQRLRDMGQKDIVLDPGFGFGKTMEENFRLMDELDCLLVMELPLLVGISRKSMIYKTLGVTPEEALAGTVALNTVALLKGASILRVHDVREAVDCCRMVTQCITKN
jgi:dihydropteroate synthase